MEFVRRMGDMQMSSSAMSSTLTMASTMLMATDLGSMESDDMTSMHMFFTTHYKNYPVLFESLAAANGGQAFGIFLLLFVVGILLKGCEFLKNYLEQVVWKNPVYIECHPGEQVVSNETTKSGDCCGTKEGFSEGEERSYGQESSEEITPRNNLRIASIMVRNAIRLALCIIPELFGFALMLATMSFTLTYFFAVVLGLGIGRFSFDLLSDRLNLKPFSQSGMHC
ncbi:uncharacterized protein PRCAT00001911001 [Priceomyces carsonii]|uniref:uncharacterized protein n=1 Tax=Priceomyces carsonii TaxID=28549 RepID=UPI002ED87610|nr:unnamed protein product [Priceomyces carsonii]